MSSQRSLPPVGCLLGGVSDISWCWHYKPLYIKTMGKFGLKLYAPCLDDAKSPNELTAIFIRSNKPKDEILSINDNNLLYILRIIL